MTSLQARIAVLVARDIERGTGAWRLLAVGEVYPDGAPIWVPVLDSSYDELPLSCRYGSPPRWVGAPLASVADWGRALRLWACDCAEAVLPVFEAVGRPNDSVRLRRTLEISRFSPRGRPHTVSPGG